MTNTTYNEDFALALTVIVPCLFLIGLLMYVLTFQPEPDFITTTIFSIAFVMLILISTVLTIIKYRN